MSTPAGWYTDPMDSTRQRWWDGAQWATESHPRSGLGAAAVSPTSMGQSFASVSAPATVYPVAPYAAGRIPNGIAAGKNTNTVGVWLYIAAMILAGLSVLLLNWGAYADFFRLTLESASPGSDPDSMIVLSSIMPWFTSMLWMSLAMYGLIGLSIVFAWLDWRALSANGVPKPFHWAWAFFAFAGAGAFVYMIGRSVVARRRTGSGLVPLFVWIGLQVATSIILGFVLAGIFGEIVQVMQEAAYGVA